MLDRFQKRLIDFWAAPMPMFLSALLGPALFGLFLLIFIHDEVTNHPTKNSFTLFLTTVAASLICMWGTVVWVHLITPYVALGSLILLICLGTGWYCVKILKHFWHLEIAKSRRLVKVLLIS